MCERSRVLSLSLYAHDVSLSRFPMWLQREAARLHCRTKLMHTHQNGWFGYGCLSAHNAHIGTVYQNVQLLMTRTHTQPSPNVDGSISLAGRAARVEALAPRIWLASSPPRRMSSMLDDYVDLEHTCMCTVVVRHRQGRHSQQYAHDRACRMPKRVSGNTGQIIVIVLICLA